MPDPLPSEQVEEARRKYATEFDVPDGGRYSNDWATRIDSILAALLDRDARLKAAEAHLGADPTNARIREAHSAMLFDWLGADEERHLVYKQGHDERCYICTLLARLKAAEEALREICSLASFEDEHTASFDDLRQIARQALDAIGGEER